MSHRNQYPEIPRPVVAYKYTVVPDAPTTQALTAQDLRDALRIIDVAVLPDAQANSLILTAQSWAESRIGFILFKSAVTTFRNGFTPVGFELRRYPVMPGETITLSYMKDNVLTVVASTVYFLGERSFYSVLFLKDGQFWPTDGDNEADSVKITFFAGFGATATSLPLNIVAGIKALAVYLYENPGDCNGCESGKIAFPSDASLLLGTSKPLKV